MPTRITPSSGTRPNLAVDQKQLQRDLTSLWVSLHGALPGYHMPPTALMGTENGIVNGYVTPSDPTHTTHVTPYVARRFIEQFGKGKLGPAARVILHEWTHAFQNHTARGTGGYNENFGYHPLAEAGAVFTQDKLGQLAAKNLGLSYIGANRLIPNWQQERTFPMKPIEVGQMPPALPDDAVMRDNYNLSHFGPARQELLNEPGLRQALGGFHRHGQNPIAFRTDPQTTTVTIGNDLAFHEPAHNRPIDRMGSYDQGLEQAAALGPKGLRTFLALTQFGRGPTLQQLQAQAGPAANYGLRVVSP